MLSAAYIWVLVGVGTFHDISPVHPGVFHLVLPASVRGWMWIGTAAVALITALLPAATSRTRRWWGLDLTPLGIGALVCMPLLRCASYASGWAMSLLPGGSPGYPDGWYASALYLGLIFWVLLTASIPSMPAWRASTGRATRDE